MPPTHDEVLFAALIESADTTISDFDLMSLVGACVEVLVVTAAGIMLADQRSSLRVFASTDEETRMLELFELQNNDGPCLEAFHTGRTVEGVDLSQHVSRWPSFAPAAMSAGINTAYAVPMRLRDQTIGALNLFLEGTEPFGRRDLGVARVMADMATIGIIKNWSIRQQENLAQPLQGALTSRVVTQRGRTWGLIGAVQRADPYLPRGRLRRGKGLPSPGCSLA